MRIFIWLYLGVGSKLYFQNTVFNNSTEEFHILFVWGYNTYYIN